MQSTRKDHRPTGDGTHLGRCAAEALERLPEVLEAYLFGSTARSESQPHSDVDVAVFVDRTRDEPSAYGTQARLTALLGQALGRDDVDVLLLNTAPPLLYGAVVREGILLCSRDRNATRLRAARALSRYLDFLPQVEKWKAARRGTCCP